MMFILSLVMLLLSRAKSIFPPRERDVSFVSEFFIIVQSVVGWIGLGWIGLDLDSQGRAS